MNMVINTAKVTKSSEDRKENKAAGNQGNEIKTDSRLFWKTRVFFTAGCPLVLQVSMSGPGREEWSQQLLPIIRHWESLLAPHPGLNPSRRSSRTLSRNVSLQLSGISDPLEHFLAAEHDYGRRVVEVVSCTLNSISRILKGSEGIPRGAEMEALCLYQKLVPRSWSKIWEGPENPFEYCTAVIERFEAMDNLMQKRRLSRAENAWLDNGEGGWRINLSHWFHPRTFLSAMRQYIARHLKIPINGLRISSCWGDEAANMRISGHVCVEVDGLYIQGANFDGTKLTSVSQVLLKTDKIDSQWMIIVTQKHQIE